jgi:DNA-binding NarL/FixJ family response regulator
VEVVSDLRARAPAHRAICPAPTASAVPATQPLVRTVLLVDDHELVRAGIKALYQSLNELHIQWLEAASLQEAMKVYQEQAAIDAVLLDLNLGDCKGLQGLRLFMQAFPQARVAVFSGTQDEFVVRQARALGAVGYVPKGTLMSEMSSTLMALLNPNQRGSSRAKMGALFPQFPASAMYDRVAELGPRHIEILELVLSGCSNQEISTNTQLSLGTVKNYVSSLLLALDVRSRSHMISLFR